MAIELAFDLFMSPQETELIALRKEVQEYKNSSERVRKGTYAKIGEMNKIITDLKSRLEVIEINICKGTHESN